MRVLADRLISLIRNCTEYTKRKDQMVRAVDGYRWSAGTPIEERFAKGRQCSQRLS